VPVVTPSVWKFLKNSTEGFVVDDTGDEYENPMLTALNVVVFTGKYTLVRLV
jgi:hypothetical protein